MRSHAEMAATLPAWWHATEGRVQLRNAKFRNVNLQNATLSNANLTAADFTDALMRSAVLDGAWLEQAVFERADLTSTSFIASNSSQADFREALLEDSRFDRSVLRFSVFTGALLENADFTGADLWGAKMDGVEAPAANFRGAVLREVSFVDSDLSGADFREATLKIADFSKARLKGANFRGADLAGANLAEADLSQAELVQLSLLTCDLTHVRLAGAWMERTRIRVDQLGGALGEEVAGEWPAARQGYLDLEQNFRGLGDAEAASWCYRRARRMGKRDARRLTVENWRRRDFRALLLSATACASDSFVEWLCDYGESLSRVIRAYLVVMILFAVFYGVSGSLLHSVPSPTGAAEVPARGVFDLLSFSFLDMTTSTTPDIGLRPASRLVYFVGSVQYMTGVLLIGLFGFVLGNRIRR